LNFLESTRSSFARHETFYPRYGWLRKAHGAVGVSPTSFTDEDATVNLGVGKNMVNAIRYWGTAFKIIQPSDSGGARGVTRYEATHLGDKIFGNNGVDPYLEELSTLWLLHWQLLKAPCSAPLWWLTFNHFDSSHLSLDGLVSFAEDRLSTVPEIEIAAGSLRKDADCLLKMYAPGRRPQRHGGADELVDCPFRELHLIEPVPGDSTQFQFSLSSKAGLPDDLVAAVALEFMANESGARTVSLIRLARDPGSPGRIFKLTEDALRARLAKVAGTYPWLSLSDTAGMPQFGTAVDPSEAFGTLLEGFIDRTESAQVGVHR
jgi:hypothetical protein